MTGYRILKLNQTDGQTGAGLWLEMDEVEADNAARAERTAVEQYGEGTYVAVPNRSWKPTTYQTRTTTKVLKTPYGVEVPA